MEEEQEQLNSSLLALTTHFAQVQFRLKQIVSADNDDKEVGVAPLFLVACYSIHFTVYRMQNVECSLTLLVMMES